MGGRGATSGISDKGKPYGTEFSTIYKTGNIKFVKYNDSKSAKSPMETMTKGRVYVTVNAKNELKTITFYDSNGKRKKSIDLNHSHQDLGLHVHHGYEHNEKDNEKGATGLSTQEKKLVDYVNKLWYNKNSK